MLNKKLSKISIFMTVMLVAYCTPHRSYNDTFQTKNFYYWEESLSAFQPCNNSEIYWLDGDKISIKLLQTYYPESRKDKFNKPVYVKLIVTNIGYQYDGSASNYDEALYLNKIISVEYISSYLYCSQPPMRDY